MKKYINPKDILFQSKIEDLFIELNNYNYFHSPSSLDFTDKRLIGREKEEQELKRILLNSETSSGTYLVTGFRGIGKTSLVTKTLSDIKGYHLFNYGRFITIYFFALIPVLFDFYNIRLFNVAFAVLNVLAILHLIRRYLRVDKFSLVTLFKSVGRFRSLNNDFSDYSQLLIKITLLSLILRQLSIPNNLDFRSQAFIFLSILIGYISISIIRGIFLSVKNDEINSTKELTKKVVKSLGHIISKSVRGSSLQFVHLNLGKDNINEKDVMKQILQALFNNYSAYMSFFKPSRLIWLFILGVGLIVFQGLYYYRPIFEGLNNIKGSAGYYEYFPSQKIFNINSPDLGDIDDRLMRVSNITEFHTEIESLLMDTVQNPGSAPSFQKKVANELDFMFFQIHMVIRKRINSLVSKEGFNPTKIGFVSTNDFYSIVPLYPDYFLLIYLFIIITIIHFGGVYRWFGIYTNRYIFRRIKSLKERLDAEILIQKNGKGEFNSKTLFNLSFSGNKSKKYPLADGAVIEAELISIFKCISLIPVFLSRPKFIFIFDELDKIEPYANQNLMDKEAAEDLDSVETQKNYGSTESHRNRQQMVSRLLAGLKFFFNTVDARFIFIAGREMYDASLADTSDRESFIGSIFNKVIYVNSFYSDDSDNKLTDITSMTEAYVCQFLENGDRFRYPTLEDYYQALKTKLKIRINGIKFPTQLLKDDFENPIDYQLYVDFKNKLYGKILFTIQNFITYLTYRSNGSPKKVTQLFEEFISDVRDSNLSYSVILGQRFDRISGADKHLWINRPQGLYLRFTEEDQYKFAFTSSLFTPFINARGRYLKRLGDKLLVSTSFLIDHLYKYHKSAFSWQNLELTPEIIAINKAPELRDFIENILRYFTKTNFREIISGLHDFKFDNKIRGEINYISKISEMEAAAFNFTLDESLKIKRHYQKKLQEERTTSAKYELDIQKQYIHTTGMYNMIIGDLYFYDEEFDEAIRYYKNAIQELRYIVTDRSLERPIYLLGLYLKNSMKLALAFEKQNSYDRAFSTYNRLTHEIIRNRDINLRELFGVKEMRLHFDGIGPFVEQMLDPTIILKGFSFNNSTKNLHFEISEIVERYKAMNSEFDTFINTIKNFFIEKITPSSGWEITQTREFDYLEEKKIDLKTVAKYLLSTRFENKNDFIDIIVDDPEKFQKRTYQNPRNSANRYEFFSFPENLFTVSKQQFSYSVERHEISILRNFYENLRLAYQPIVAKLAMLEKNALHGISFSDLMESDNEMYFLMKPMPSLERGLLLSEYLNRVGDVLYFKNGLVPHSSLNMRLVQKNNNEVSTNPGENAKYITINLSLKKKDFLKLFEINISTWVKRYFNAPYSAFEYYFRSLRSLTISYCPNYTKRRQNQSNINSKREDRKKLYGWLTKSGFKRYCHEETVMLKSLLITVVNGIYSSDSILGKDALLNSFAAALADLGDTYYSMAHLGDVLPGPEFLDLFNFNSEPFTYETGNIVGASESDLFYQDKRSIKSIFKNKKLKKNDKIHKAVLYYFMSYLFLSKAGNYRSASEKLLRIITMYSECHPHDKKDLLKNNRLLFRSLKKVYFKSSLLIHKSFDNTIRPEKLRYAYLTNIFYTQGWSEDLMNQFNGRSLKNDTDNYLDRLYLKHSSINSFLKDLYITMAKIVLNLELINDLYNGDTTAENLYRMKRQLINPFISNSSNFTRVFELTLATRINYKIAVEKRLIRTGDIMPKANLTDKHEAIALSKICIDSIYCTNAILEITYLSGHSFLVFNSITGIAHKWLGEWCHWLKQSLRSLMDNGETEVFNDILYELKATLNETKRVANYKGNANDYSALDIYNLDSSYQYERAIERFNLAIQTHNEGKEYKNFISHLYYLEDDFNDELIHFYAARERFMINTGSIDKHLHAINNHLKDSETNNFNVILKDYIMENE